MKARHMRIALIVCAWSGALDVAVVGTVCILATSNVQYYAAGGIAIAILALLPICAGTLYTHYKPLKSLYDNSKINRYSRLFSCGLIIIASLVMLASSILLMGTLLTNTWHFKVEGIMGLTLGCAYHAMIILITICILYKRTALVFLEHNDGAEAGKNLLLRASIALLIRAVAWTLLTGSFSWANIVIASHQLSIDYWLVSEVVFDALLIAGFIIMALSLRKKNEIADENELFSATETESLTEQKSAVRQPSITKSPTTE